LAPQKARRVRIHSGWGSSRWIAECALLHFTRGTSWAQLGNIGPVHSHHMWLRISMDNWRVIMPPRGDSLSFNESSENAKWTWVTNFVFTHRSGSARSYGTFFPEACGDRVDVHGYFEAAYLPGYRIRRPTWRSREIKNMQATTRTLVSRRGASTEYVPGRTAKFNAFIFTGMRIEIIGKPFLSRRYSPTPLH